jgi:glycosyltransferase involved in cell wall biosynthesis
VQTYNPAVATLVRRRLDGCDMAIAFEIPAACYLLDCDRPFIVEELELGALRNPTTGMPVLRRLKARLTWWKTAGFVRHLAAKAAHVTVASEEERAHVVGAGCNPERITVVPNGVSAADLAVRETATRDTLIYPGAITYSANLDAMQFFLASILPRIRHTRPSVVLTITGDADQDARRRLPPQAGVILTGRLSDIRTAVGRSHVAVVPLRQGGGTRLKVLQAMAIGTPVVSTSKGIEGLGLAPGLDVLVADEPDLFAAHVTRLLEDDALHAQLAARGRTVAAGREWQHSGELLNSIVERAMSGGPA